MSVAGYRDLVSHAEKLFLASFACAGILYLGYKILPVLGDGLRGGLDFQVIWLAGKLWAGGENPYGPAFAQAHFEIFGPGPDALWLYPPYWYPLTLPLGALPFSISNVIWKFLNFTLLIAASHLIARALADATNQKYTSIFLAGLGFVCFMEATAVTLFNGQTSVIVYFGFAALIYGILKARSLPLIIGLVILAMKPQIGIVAFAAVAALRPLRWTVLAAGGICILATLPIMFTADYRASIEGFVANIARQPDLSANTPPNLTGLIHILDSLPWNFGGLLATALCIGTAIFSAIAIFHFSIFNRGAKTVDACHGFASLALFMSSLFFMVPLHSYDLIALVALLMMAMAILHAGRWLVASGLFLLIRPELLSNVLGVADPDSPGFPENHLVSAALLFILLGTIWAIIGTRPKIDAHAKN